MSRSGGGDMPTPKYDKYKSGLADVKKLLTRPPLMSMDEAMQPAGRGAATYKYHRTPCACLLPKHVLLASPKRELTPTTSTTFSPPNTSPGESAASAGKSPRASSSSVASSFAEHTRRETDGEAEAPVEAGQLGDSVTPRTNDRTDSKRVSERAETTTGTSPALAYTALIPPNDIFGGRRTCKGIQRTQMAAHLLSTGSLDCRIGNGTDRTAGQGVERRKLRCSHLGMRHLSGLFISALFVSIACLHGLRFQR